jgi:hypothetical protein
MGRRRKGAKRGRGGRLLEVIANTVLVLIVVAFGLSIAKRYGSGDQAERRVEPTSLVVDRVEPMVDPEELRERPTVDIRNGCGTAGLAERLMRELRGSGFDVVEYRNADRYDYDRTVVKDRSGREGAAGLLRSWVRNRYGVGEIVDDRVGVPEADLVLIIGADLADSLEARTARTE